MAGGIAAAAAPWFGAMVEVVVGGGHVEMVVRDGGMCTMHSISM